MKMNFNKTGMRRAVIINIVYFAMIAGIIYFLLRFFVPMSAPFLIGFVLASVLAPLIRRICAEWKVKRSLVAIACLIVCYFVIFSAIGFFGSHVLSFIQEQAVRLPRYYYEFLYPGLMAISDKILASSAESSQTIARLLESIETRLQSGIMDLSGVIVSMVASWIMGFPGFLIQLIFTVISSFFFTLDYETVVAFILRQFQPETQAMVVEVVSSAKIVTWKILRVYALLMTITFLELYAGFTILRIPMAAPTAFLVAVVDILPVLGTGTVLIPWGLLMLILGDTSLGVGILVLYLIITVVRQSLEPKIIGSQVGLHPIITLLCIFAGAQLIGVVGIFAFPVMATIIKKMNDDGTIHFFR